MSTQPGGRPPIVWIVATVALALYAGLLWYQLGSTQDALRTAQGRESQLLGQLQSLAVMQAAPREAGQGLDGPAEAIGIALLQRPDLIEHEPVPGGRFYFLEDSVRVLSGRYAYAEFEDGHVVGHALIRYEIDEDGGVSLALIDSYLP